MKNEQNKQDWDEVLEEEAVAWIARLASGDASTADKSQAQEWRERSPQHEQAFQKARRLWLGMEGVRGLITPTMDSKYPLEKKSEQTVLRRWVVAAMLALVALGGLLQEDWLRVRLADHYTGTGERTSLSLADGSVIHLNTHTALSVDYTASIRRVDLLTGEAQFVVAKDDRRPFVVHAAEGQTRAVGTAFFVRNYEEGATVTLLEGLVDVTVDSFLPGEQAGVHLYPGEQVTYDVTKGLAQTQSANLRLASAWQRGLLIFEDTKLLTVVEEINRYRKGYVVLATDEIADYRVSGVFYLDNLDQALTTIQSQLHLSALRFTDYIVFLQ